MKRKKFTDKKMFWETIKPFLPEKKSREKTTLISNEDWFQMMLNYQILSITFFLI